MKFPMYMEKSNLRSKPPTRMGLNCNEPPVPPNLMSIGLDSPHEYYNYKIYKYHIISQSEIGVMFTNLAV
jgi:hypothetical protein